MKLSDQEVQVLFGFPIKRTFTFTENSGAIAASDREILYYIANFLRERGEYAVEIVGFSDPAKENPKISLDRANNVKNILQNGGLENYKIHRTYENSEVAAMKVEITFYRI